MMNKINALRKFCMRVLMASILFWGASCSTPNSPRPIAEKFLIAFQNHNFEEAKQYSTKETIKLLQILERISSEDDSVTHSSAAVAIISEEIAGEKATVYFKEEGNETEQKLMLKKVSVEGETEKQWRVVLTKEDARMRK